ncbi:hypothetical protein BDZ89DRAFT_1056356 [Hymenopellis radicata]|nr:hypothetical protein BDZ89DRAFT_1056356 [Hymenopellis radicata]
MSDEDYEVENILSARVGKKGRSGKQLFWEYRVKWKGYPNSENTHSGTLWEQASTAPRDRDDLSSFNAGEEFYPLRSSKNSREKSSPPPPSRKEKKNTTSTTSKRKRSPSVEVIDVLSDTPAPPPTKRSKGRPRKSVSAVPQKSASAGPSKPRKTATSVPVPQSSSSPRKPSPQIVPDSEEERGRSPSDEPVVTSKKSRNTNGQAAGTTSNTTSEYPNEDALSHYNPDPDDDPAGLFGPSSPEPISNPVAAPRTREARPLVKRIEADQRGSAPSTKARAANNTPSPKKSRPGPGRPSTGLKPKAKSSLLTFTKAGPQILKGHYPRLPQNPEATSGPSRVAAPSNVNDDAEMGSFMNVDDDNSPPAKDRGPPPTSEELLALAGLNAQAANELEDYEEDETPAESAPAAAPSPATNEGLVQSVIAQASAMWKRSSIFGPLGIGSDTLPATTESSDSPLFIHLDHSVLIPVHVLDVHPQDASSPFTIDKKGPPGTFYDKQKAQKVIDALRTGGPSGRIVLASEATDDQKEHFDRFRERLQDDSLFMLPFDRDVLAICSSKSALVCQRLNLPQILVGGVDSLLLSRVSVENYMAYADAVA